MTDRPIRPGVLHHLVTQMGTPSRLKLQKMSYLLQEGLEIPTAYRFKMHHQGPISDELTNVTDWMRGTGYLEIWDDPDKPGYLVIVRTDPEAEWLKPVQDHEEKLNHVLSALGQRPDEYLELLASVHFVQRLQPDNTREKTLEIASAMKPGIDPTRIDAAYTDLEELGML